MQTIKPIIFGRTAAVSKLLAKYLVYATYLSNFISDPDNTVTKLAESDVPEIADVFKNVKLALIGEHTRGKGIEYGKQNIFNILSGIVTDIEKEYMYVKDGISDMYKTVLDNVSIVESTTNTSVLTARKELYNYNLMSKEFLMRRAVSQIATSLLLQNDKYNGLSTFFSKVAELLPINDLVDYNELNKVKTIYLNSLTIIDSDNSITEVVRDLVTLETLGGEELDTNIVTEEDIVNMLNKMEFEVPDVYPTELLDKLIDKLPLVVSKVGHESDILDVTVNDFTTNNNFLKYVKDMLEVANTYSSVTITEDEYLTRTKNYLDMLMRHLSADHALLSYVANIINSINFIINKFLAIYAIVDKITLSGTVEIVKASSES